MIGKLEAINGGGCPHRGLLSAIIHRAVEESLKLGSITGVPRHTKPRLMAEAKEWLRNSDMCRHYCNLLDLCHKAMVERLELQWSSQ